MPREPIDDTAPCGCSQRRHYRCGQHWSELDSDLRQAIRAAARERRAS